MSGAGPRLRRTLSQLNLPVRAVAAPDVLDLRQADCLEFLRELPDASVDLIVTDPAYSGMNQHLKLGRGRIVGDYNGGREAETSGKWFREFHDNPETFRVLLAECHRVLRDDRHLYLMFDSYSFLSLAPLVREQFAVKNVITWDKVNLGMGHYFRRRHELILFASKGKRPLARRDLPDVWRIKRLGRAPYPTQKPVELFELMIVASAAPGFTVCDPFMGSGSAALAALRQGCGFLGCDTSESAVDLARVRVEGYLRTGTDSLQPKSQLANEDYRLNLRPKARQASATSGKRKSAAAPR